LDPTSVLSDHVTPVFSVPKWALVAILPLIAFTTLVATWAVDTAAHAGEVPRNVTLAGQSIGGLGDDDLRARLERVAGRFRLVPVMVETRAGLVQMTAGELGASIDIDATMEAVKQGFVEADSSGPLTWLDSFIESRPAELVLSFDVGVAATSLNDLAIAGTAPVEPQLDGSSGRLAVVAGRDGRTIDIDAMVASIPAAIGGTDAAGVVTARWKSLSPMLTATDIEALAQEADVVVSSNVRLQSNNFVVPLPPEVAATWFSSKVTATGGASLVMDNVLALADLQDLLAPGDFSGTDVAVFDVVDGEVVVSAAQPRRRCCLDSAVATLVRNVRSGLADPVILPVEISTPQTVVDNASKLGIVTEVASFTTEHIANQSRVTNIQLFADLMRGQVIEPGETVSLNNVVGKRTREKGFVGGGFISNGVLISDIGGGISQFATTMFNAAFFAGLDFESYQAHSIYFSRYPYGREATISFPQPDLVIENTTPYGVLIWPTYTPTSITVTLYSTKFVDVEQTDQRTSFDGQCRRVRTERTRTYLSGEVVVDSVQALYRPGEGLRCDGSSSVQSAVTGTGNDGHDH